MQLLVERAITDPVSGAFLVSVTEIHGHDGAAR
jgi:hypothetical protein